MKQVGQLALVGLSIVLVVPPALATSPCAPLVASKAGCASGPRSIEEPGDCPHPMTTQVQVGSSCCQFVAPDFMQQALVDSSAGDQEIGTVVMKRALFPIVPPALLGFEPDNACSMPFLSVSLQSLHCTFLI